jgi:hypothetical protein
MRHREDQFCSSQEPRNQELWHFSSIPKTLLASRAPLSTDCLAGTPEATPSAPAEPQSAAPSFQRAAASGGCLGRWYEGSLPRRWRRGRRRRWAQRNERPGSEGRRGVHGMQWKSGVCRFWFFAGERQLASCGGEDGSRREELQLGGSKVGGWMYTNWEPEVQNGNSG